MGPPVDSVQLPYEKWLNMVDSSEVVNGGDNSMVKQTYLGGPILYRLLINSDKWDQWDQYGPMGK